MILTKINNHENLLRDSSLFLLSTMRFFSSMETFLKSPDVCWHLCSGPRWCRNPLEQNECKVWNDIKTRGRMRKRISYWDLSLASWTSFFLHSLGDGDQLPIWGELGIGIVIGGLLLGVAWWLLGVVCWLPGVAFTGASETLMTRELSRLAKLLAASLATKWFFAWINQSIN